MDARDTIEQWRASIPEDGRSEASMGAALVGVGIVAAAFMLLRRRRGLLAWVIPGAIIGAGMVMLGDVMLDTRTVRIAETEELIAAELSSLDPIARAQVLKGVSERQVKEFIPGRD